MKQCVKIWWSQTGHRCQYNTTHAHCMIDNLRNRHKIVIYNIYCFSTATMITRNRHNVTFARALPVLFQSNGRCLVGAREL